IATLVPTSALVSVDLPVFGRPTRQAKPARCGVSSLDESRGPADMGQVWRTGGPLTSPAHRRDPRRAGGDRTTRHRSPGVNPGPDAAVRGSEIDRGRRTAEIPDRGQILRLGWLVRPADDSDRFQA